MLTRMWKLKAGHKKVARKATELRKEMLDRFIIEQPLPPPLKLTNSCELN